MAITFRGTAVSYLMPGNDSTLQGLFLIENGIRSRVNLYIRRLTVQNDVNALLTTVMPLVKVSRVTEVTARGISLEKVPFDTALASDGAVKVWCASPHSPLEVTAGAAFWEQYTIRSRTAAEQKMAWDNNLLPWFVSKSGSEFILKPGQSLYVQVVAPNAASNTFDMHNWFVQAAWEEEALPTFSISGVVTLAGVPVVGAKVLIMQADNKQMINGFLREIVTTVAGGVWSSSILSGKVGAAFVQHETGGTLYTASGSPFLEQ